MLTPELSIVHSVHWTSQKRTIHSWAQAPGIKKHFDPHYTQPVDMSTTQGSTYGYVSPGTQSRDYGTVSTSTRAGQQGRPPVCVWTEVDYRDKVVTYYAGRMSGDQMTQRCLTGTLKLMSAGLTGDEAKDSKLIDAMNDMESGNAPGGVRFMLCQVTGGDWRPYSASSVQSDMQGRLAQEATERELKKAG